MKFKVKTLELAIKLSFDTAKKACGKASIFDWYQTKELIGLTKKLKTTDRIFYEASIL